MTVMETLAQDLPVVQSPCGKQCSYYGPNEPREITSEVCRLAKTRAHNMGIPDINCGAVALQAIHMVEIYNTSDTLSAEEGEASAA